MSRLKNDGSQIVRNHGRRGVWVPAFAGTTIHFFPAQRVDTSGAVEEKAP